MGLVQMLTAVGWGTIFSFIWIVYRYISGFSNDIRRSSCSTRSMILLVSETADVMGNRRNLAKPRNSQNRKPDQLPFPNPAFFISHGYIVCTCGVTHTKKYTTAVHLDISLSINPIKLTFVYFL